MNSNKRMLVAVLVGLFLLFAFVQFRGKPGGPAPLRLYAWSNYFSDEQLAEFTKRTGIKVELSLLSSNEELFAKLKAGASGYDLIQPSDYMVRQLRHNDMLEPLVLSQIPNLRHLGADYRNVPYDPGQQYSVPVSWGTVGIAVNTKVVPMLTTDDVSWKLLLESPKPKQTSLLDDMREVFGAALYFKGLSINTKNFAELEEAKKYLLEVKSRVLLFSSEPKSLLLKGEIAIAQMYSIDAAQAAAENNSIRYFLPKEGASAWTDNLSIPKGAQNRAAAHAFIDFMMEPEQSAKLSRDKLVATPNAAALELLPPVVRTNRIVYPTDETKARLHYLDDLGDELPKWTKLWTELKT